MKFVPFFIANLVVQAFAFSSNYLDSLALPETASPSPAVAPAMNYLDSHINNSASVGVGSAREIDFPTAVFPKISHNDYVDPINHAKDRPIFGLEQVAAETPSDHYAKDHPGAGWAGYHHPMFGGYLNHLKQNVWEEGKEADYGDDVRWGAQVYLDKI